METIINIRTRIDQLVVKAKLNVPEAADMIDKAADIAKGEGVTVITGRERTTTNIDGTERTFIARVKSQSSRYPYVIYSTPHGLTCNCKFFVKGNGRRPTLNGQPLCKHIVAMSLVDKAEQDVAETNAAVWRGMKQGSAKAGNGREQYQAEQRERRYWESEAGKNHLELLGAGNNGAQFDDMMARRPNRLQQFPEGM